MYYFGNPDPQCSYLLARTHLSQKCYLQLSQHCSKQFSATAQTKQIASPLLAFLDALGLLFITLEFPKNTRRAEAFRMCF